MRKEKHDFTPKFDQYGKRCKICGKQEYWCGRDQWEPTGPCPKCGDDSSTTWMPTYDDIQGVMNYVCSNCGFSPSYEPPAKEVE